jgi:AraC-like DNA-binding protein
LTEYISRKRIALAQELLRATNLKIVEICYRVGFRDLAHFNRTFKRLTGATPNQYRQSAAAQPVHTVPSPAILHPSQPPRDIARAAMTA